jgi:putative phage-associated protein
MSKVSEAQKKASRKYEELNREQTRINNYRRTARLFVKSYANEEDMQELIKIYNENKDNRV